MQLVTERLILREFSYDDWLAVWAYQRDPRYLRYYAWPERTPEAVQDFVQLLLAQQQTQPRITFQLAVVLKADEQLIGNCGIRKQSVDATEADIGYELAPDRWVTGTRPELPAPSSTSGSPRSTCTASGHGVLRRIPARRGTSA